MLERKIQWAIKALLIGGVHNQCTTKLIQGVVVLPLPSFDPFLGASSLLIVRLNAEGRDTFRVFHLPRWASSGFSISTASRPAEARPVVGAGTNTTIGKTLSAALIAAGRAGPGDIRYPASLGIAAVAVPDGGCEDRARIAPPVERARRTMNQPAPSRNDDVRYDLSIMRMNLANLDAALAALAPKSRGMMAEWSALLTLARMTKQSLDDLSDKFETTASRRIAHVPPGTVEGLHGCLDVAS
ncbi:MAG: hypothetical protein AAFP13_01050 [Pseudomonadota bacterium]